MHMVRDGAELIWADKIDDIEEIMENMEAIENKEKCKK